MSLYKRGNVWWSRIERNGEVMQRSTGCANKNDARDVEAVWKADIAKGAVGIFKPPTLDEFSVRFINYLPTRVSKRTFRFYVDAWASLTTEKSPLAKLKLNQIDGPAVEKWIQWRLNQPYQRGEKGQERKVGVTTVNRNIQALRRALHLAADWHLIPRAPRISLLRGEKAREETISEETLAKFLELCDSPELSQTIPFQARLFHPEMKTILPFLVDTGLRAGELCRLNWEDVNLNGRGSVFVRMGKTKYARRTVPLTTRAKEIMENLPHLQTTNAVFTRNGQRVQVGWMSHQFTAMRRKLGRPEGLVLHSCRHTFCTRLGAKGVSPYVLQKLAGHASIVISARYCHPDAAQLESAVGLLEAR